MIPPVKTAVMDYQAIAASTGYVLVDLSDTTNYPHEVTGHIEVLGFSLSAEKAGDGVYDFWFGVITEVDASNGSADWFKLVHFQTNLNFTDSTDRLDVEADFTLGGSNPNGINCLVVAEALPHMITNVTQNGNSTWQNDTGLGSPAGAAAGATGKPGAGDIVLWVEEVSGSGTVDFCITLFYRACE